MAAGFGGNDAAELRPHTAGFNMSSTPMAQKCLRRFVSLAWKDCLKDLDAPYRSGLSKELDQGQESEITHRNRAIDGTYNTLVKSGHRATP